MVAARRRPGYDVTLWPTTGAEQRTCTSAIWRPTPADAARCRRYGRQSSLTNDAPCATVYLGDNGALARRRGQAGGRYQHGRPGCDRGDRSRGRGNEGPVPRKLLWVGACPPWRADAADLAAGERETSNKRPVLDISARCCTSGGHGNGQRLKAHRQQHAGITSAAAAELLAAGGSGPGRS